MRQTMKDTPLARVVRGKMPVQYLYTAGVAGERFFQTVKTKGVFMATTCRECRITYLPPRVYCERCFADLSETWSQVPSTGRVYTYTVVHQDQDGQPVDPPQIVAFVRMDGTDGGLIGRLVKTLLPEVHLDMPVEAVLCPPRQRRGTLDDITGFAPRQKSAPSRQKR
jgi:uncharacterized OB-fold protein